MKKIKIYLKEAGEFENLLDIQPNKVEVFLGRMQPVHNGHVKAVGKLKNPVIVLIKGKKSSEDKKKNPFEGKDQIMHIRKAMPGVKLIVSDTGYLPDIFAQLREEKFEPVAVIAGPDRFPKYKGMIDSVNAKLPDEKKFTVKMKKAPRVTSATEIRLALAQGDLKTFKKNMPKALWGDFGMMQKAVKKAF